MQKLELFVRGRNHAMGRKTTGLILPGIFRGRMYFPQFLVGATAALAVIFGWIYSVTGSFWVSLAWTVISAVVLQVGYFACLLVMIFRRVDEATDADRAVQKKPDGASPAKHDGTSF